MPDHAGFAAAITIRESLLNVAVLAGWSGSISPTRFSTGDIAGGPPDANIDAFLAPPTIHCDADGYLSITFHMWGAFTVTMNGVTSARTVDATMIVRLRPTFVISGMSLQLSPVENDLQVSEWDFVVIKGGDFPTEVDAFARSAAFTERLRDTVYAAVLLGRLTLPAIDVSFLGSSLPSAVQMTADSRVRDGALLIGLNLVSDKLTLIGNSENLVDFARNNDLASVINAAAVPAFLKDDVDTPVRNAVAAQGATVDRLDITSQGGKFHVDAAASKDGAQVTFSFDLIAAMSHTREGAVFRYLKKPVRVNTRTWPAIDFSIANLNTDTNRSGLLVLAEFITGLFTLGVVTSLIERAIASAAYQTRTDVLSQPLPRPIARVQHTRPERTGGAGTRIEITTYEVSTDGTYIGITIRAEAPLATVIGLVAIPGNYRNSALSYQAQLPSDARLDDPALYIRWTVTDLATGTVVAQDDGLAVDRAVFAFTPDAVAAGATRLRVACRVYRALGFELTDILNDGVTLEIRGPLPAGAYVQWRYDVKNPQVVLDDDPERWVYAGDAVVKRWSALHRTDRPCANASKRSRYTYETNVVDALPFPITELQVYRSQLCDYCFFGGPGRLRPSL